MASTSVADELTALFNRYNLGSLAQVVLNLNKSGVSDSELELQLQETQEWKTRFAGNEARRAKGLRVLSPAEYLSREEGYLAIARQYELPQGFLDDQEDWAKLIGGNVDTEELQQRLDARKAIFTDGAGTGVLDYARSAYGLGMGDLMAMYIDPDRGAASLTKMARASQIGAAAARTGFGAVSRDEAERLDALGVSADQAQQGFSQAASLTELTQDVGGSEGVTREDLTNAIFQQDAAAQRKVTRKQDERRATFQQGGGFAESKTGIAGLGSANT